MSINSQTLLFIIDLFQGTKIRNYYNFYRNTINWNKEKIKRYQLNKLKSLLLYAQKNVPYYKDILNFDITKMESVSELGRIPLLTRSEIQGNLYDLVSENLSVEKLHKSSSSGTTGIPITYYKDLDGISAGIAAGYYGCKISGWNPGDKSLHIWGNPTSIANWNKLTSKIKNYLKNQQNIASTEFNDPANHSGLYDYISKENFLSIDGYTSAIYELAKFIESNNLSSLNVKSVFTTAENLTEIQRHLIEKNIGPVSDDYGCGEINSIAMQPVGEKKYYIFETHVVVEAENNGTGFKNILITDLDNRAMPFIRYKVGDLIDDIHLPEGQDKLQLSYFKKIAGRDSDIIELQNGKKLLPVNILGGTLFRKIGGINKHKVRWDGKELLFYFETNNNFNLINAEMQVQAEFKKYDVPVRIEIIDKLLPDKNGKYKYFERTDQLIKEKANNHI